MEYYEVPSEYPVVLNSRYRKKGMLKPARKKAENARTFLTMFGMLVNGLLSLRLLGHELQNVLINWIEI